MELFPTQSWATFAPYVNLPSSWVTIPPGWRTEPRPTWTVCSRLLGPCQWLKCCVPVSASGFWTLHPWTRACSPGWPSADWLRTWVPRCTWLPCLWTQTWGIYQPVWIKKKTTFSDVCQRSVTPCLWSTPSNICLTHPGNLVRHLKTTIQLSSDLSSLLVQVVQLWED